MRLSRISLLRLVPVLVAGVAAAYVTPAAAQVQADTAASRAAEPVETQGARAQAEAATQAAAAAARADARILPADTPAVFLGFRRMQPWPVRLIGPRLQTERVPRHWTDLSGRWWLGVEQALAAERDSMWLGAHGLLDVAGNRGRVLAVGPDTVRYLPYEEEADTAPTLESFLPGRVGQYADLGMLVTGRGEMGGAWQRFEPCDAVFNSCEQGLAPRLRPDLQFGVLLGGTITERVHVSVDYDQTREFDAANNINVYYQGLEDEILQRFEMGDVSITMPQSQFMTGGIPGGNFGFRALAQVGPLELQSLWAQQQGDIGSLDINIDARTGSLYEENSITVDDQAYASGRFFFLVDPTQLPGYPHIDVLALEAADAPDSIRPLGETFQLYRDEQLPQSQREASSVFFARAEFPGPEADLLGGHFRRLDPSDYVLHRSGLWIMLRQPLGTNELLAMSYLTITGDTVGTLDATSVPGTDPEDAPILRLLRGPVAEHHPEAPTWLYEMHQVYQVYAGELAKTDLLVDITLGDPAQGQLATTYGDRQVQWLELFGADENSPVARVDEERIFLPSEFHTGATAITGTYLVFPTLRPFADPPPSRNLTAAQAEEALGTNANHRIYEERDPDLRSIARFRLIMSYRVETDGLVSEFSLGGFGVREASERITVDGVALRRGTDYTVDYTTGIVRLTNPQQLFAGRQSPRISATFEQNALFEIAPKSIFGTTARWRVGQAGDVNLVGLYQNQRSVMARPQLGNEPHSIMMGGLTTNLRFGAGWLDRALDAIPGLRLAGESSVGLAGEVALSLPNPNTRGQAYLDDFEATAEVPIAMSQQLWRLGSRPESTVGTAGWMPFDPNEHNVFRLVWQHQAFGTGGGTFGAFSLENIDERINTSGRPIPEAVLYVTMKDDTALAEGERVWRSMTTVLSTRGSDLTSSEYLEFYALEVTDDIALIFDLGTVSEDAFFVNRDRQTQGVREETGNEWGLGILDQEARFDQPWGVDLDRGIWDQDCETQPGILSILGSANANCTENNGINDTEDLNADGVPNLEDGEYFRYVVPIGPNSPYLARDTSETGTQFRLYRIPLRGANALAVNGAGDETWRSVRHLRMTITSGNCTGTANCQPDVLMLARMRISGSTWKKREIEGVLAGMIGGDTIPGDHSQNVHVGPVSAITEDGAYIGPPGSSDEASDPSQAFGATGVEVNEKGLRIALTDLEPDARAEVFYRFPSETRSFMQYQQMRLWALPRAGDWGPDGTLSLLVKIGTDDGNYYMYRTRLRPPVENRQVDLHAYWLPELVIDFEPWFELKALAETNAVQIGDRDTVYWNEEGTHAIVLSSRAQAPNLAGIREMSLAVHNGSGLPVDSAEVWINDLRLGDGRSETAMAGIVAFNATAADFATVRLALTNQGAMFQPMNRAATYEETSDMALNGRLELGHFAPAGWGLELPVTVQHTQQGRAPAFLNRTDIRASDLEGLRESGNQMTQVGVGVSKTTPASNPWLGLLVDGARLSLNWQNAERDAFTQTSSTSQFSGNVDYEHELQPRTFDVTPELFASLLRALAPARVEQSDFFRRVSTARLRWSPYDVTFSSSYVDRKSETLTYRTVLEGPGDTAITPVRSPQQDLLNSASIGFRPFESLSARLGMGSSRDLLAGNELAASAFGQDAVADARTSLGGLDLGWEKARTLGGTIQFQPRVAAWLRPTVGWTSDYSTSRTPHYLDYELVVDTLANDSVVVDTLNGRMQRSFEVTGQLERRLYFDPAGLARAAWGQEPAPELGLLRGLLHRTMSGIIPVDLTWTSNRSSSFERSGFEPGYGYRLGFGDLETLRFVDGDTATTANERFGFQARGGLRLPLGLQLDATYVDNDRQDVGSQGNNSQVDERTWPDLRLGLATLPIPEAVRPYLTRLSASTGYRVEHTQHDFSSARRTRDTESIPVQLMATFGNGLTASYNGTYGSSEGQETSGRRRGRDRLHAIQLRMSFDAPESLGASFDQPLTASLGFNYSSNHVCDVSGFNAPTDSTRARCAASVDRLSRDVHVTLETMIDDLNLGAQFSLNDHQSFTGLRDGNREFRLSIFANFNFGVGVLPEGLGAGSTGF